MGKRDDLVARYAADLQETCGVTADIDLLTKVTFGLGPSVYDADAARIAASDPAEIDRIRTNFLMRKLGLPDGPELGAAIDTVLERYGRSNRNKQRAVVYYLLVKHFGKEAAYA